MNQNQSEESTTPPNEIQLPQRQRQFRIGVYLVFAVVLFAGWTRIRYFQLEHQLHAAQNATIDENPWGIQPGMTLDEALPLLPPATTGALRAPEDRDMLDFVSRPDGSDWPVYIHHFFMGGNRLFLKIEFAPEGDEATITELQTYDLGVEDQTWLEWLKSWMPF
ncbi:MAG: hypothetical protein KDA65_09980 [Planctomycetaceae bacterium]|nr:hypothetical protein [Planctomycetaceae bacterium]